jgi:ribonuclease HI
VTATDGSAIGNPGPAGWAWVTDDGRRGFGAVRHSTNNRMELRAVIGLLEATAETELLVVLVDSQYAMNIFTKWLPGWRQKGMRNSRGKPVLNQDLIERVDALLRGRQVEFKWVRGHDGNALNEAAHELAYGEGRRVAARLAAEQSG